MLKRLGFTFDVVPEQDQFDGRFPTVQSPNPENAEALKLAIDLAKKKNADLVIATDPDCDRMGVAVRTTAGEMKLLTGNQIGSLIAYYRAKKLFDQGVLYSENAASRSDHQDLCHDRSAKSDRGKVWSALCRNPDRLQIHRGKVRQIRTRGETGAGW